MELSRIHGLSAHLPVIEDLKIVSLLAGRLLMEQMALVDPVPSREAPQDGTSDEIRSLRIGTLEVHRSGNMWVANHWLKLLLAAGLQL